MPRQETRYYCNVCNAFWPNEEKAAECEKSHMIPIKVDKPVYDTKDRKNEYPESVLVHFEKDGKKISARYYRA